MLSPLILTFTVGALAAGIAKIDLRIPNTAVRDMFYTASLDFAGQTLPVMVDSGSADILVASTECSNTNSSSGCYRSKLLRITNQMKVDKNETFFTLVGEGEVDGNQSFMDVGFGGIHAKDLATPLIYQAVTNEFQNGSFSGILGLGLRPVSREFHYFKQLPPIDFMVHNKLLAKPVFSVTVPRYGDPSSPKTGTLTLGGIEQNPRTKDITYSNIIKSEDYNTNPPSWQYQTWTQVLQGVRVNGVNVPIPKGGVAQNHDFIATMDTGGEMLYMGALFTPMAKLFKGKKDVIPDFGLSFDCSVPQQIEFKLNGQWIPIDPLDMILPGQHSESDGTLMCQAAVGEGSSSFSDALMGPQFFRNVLAVFDYTTDDLLSKPPRMGFAPLTNATQALARYPQLYKNRLN